MREGGGGGSEGGREGKEEERRGRNQQKGREEAGEEEGWRWEKRKEKGVKNVKLVNTHILTKAVLMASTNLSSGSSRSDWAWEGVVDHIRELRLSDSYTERRGGGRRKGKERGEGGKRGRGEEREERDGRKGERRREKERNKFHKSSFLSI